MQVLSILIIYRVYSVGHPTKCSYNLGTATFLAARLIRCRLGYYNSTIALLFPK